MLVEACTGTVSCSTSRWAFPAGCCFPSGVPSSSLLMLEDSTSSTPWAGRGAGRPKVVEEEVVVVVFCLRGMVYWLTFQMR